MPRHRLVKNPETGKMEWVELKTLPPEEAEYPGFALSNSNDGVRRFIKQCGHRPTAASVDVIGREIRRTPAENERVVAINKEIEAATGRPSLIDQQGRDVLKMVKKQAEQPVNPNR